MFILVVVLVAVIFAGCGNMSVGLGNLEFEKIHVDTHHYSGCFTVEKWYSYNHGIEAKTKEVGYMYLAEGMYILIDEDCPICDGGK